MREKSSDWRAELPSRMSGQLLKFVLPRYGALSREPMETQITERRHDHFEADMNPPG